MVISEVEVECKIRRTFVSSVKLYRVLIRRPDGIVRDMDTIIKTEYYQGLSYSIRPDET
jgi:hypothetical protein